MQVRGLTILASAMLAIALTAAPAAAQDVPAAFPKKPLTLVVPFTAGGPVDVLGRLLAQAYQERTGQPATVENKTGGAGNIGIDAVRKGPADGTNMLLIPAGNLTINPTLMKNLAFDVERDFTAVTLLATAPNIIVASHKSGITDLASLIAKGKSREVTYGSPGVGSQLHLAMELLRVKTGANLIHVPYKGSSQALNDVLGDHVDLLATNLTAALAAIQAGTVVPVAMTTAQRSALVPQVPTLAEAGVTGIDVTSWYGLLVPKAVPEAVTQAIFDVTRETMATPALRSKLEAQGLTVMTEPPAVFSERIRRETALWADVIKQRNIQLQ
ncbi:Bug family tripartite tricarboxylate transporter substrate binding protein [Rhodoplanes sp. Z2-YC6860]|uniref:Bug family tripartite tricarboxylate transporter substrate binding protein n=1 Tax=Rhodoplanes sp. Z2-YC6860 TaxID=674703 RepID=UPI000AA34D83|nr:tripartite tricarboxylate transporter substrate-binding protein [Rhodoplanes sp. Z2-YC6860]